MTGGGSGIGAGIVSAFAAQQADVTFFDVSKDGSEAVAKASGARFERVDLTRIADTQERIGQLIAEGGSFDVLVNNAANDDRHGVDEVTEEYWDDRVNVNLKHLFFCAQSVIPGMRVKR